MARLRRGDLILLIVVLSVGVGMLVYNNLDRGQNDSEPVPAGSRAVIEVDGEPWGQYPLTVAHGEVRIESDRGHNTLEFDGEGVRVREASCPDQICVYFGRATVPGQIIVCMPHRVMVRIVKQEDVDEALDGVTF